MFITGDQHAGYQTEDLATQRDVTSRAMGYYPMLIFPCSYIPLVVLFVYPILVSYLSHEFPTKLAMICCSKLLLDIKLHTMELDLHGEYNHSTK